MSDNSRVSEALYVGLCGYIGTPTEVTVRREVMDIYEMMKKPIQIRGGIRTMFSGSYREGFRCYKSSDIDIMTWYVNHKVITALSQSSVYALPEHSNIIMEDTDTPPGFVRLQLLTSPRHRPIAMTVVTFGDRMYLSSSRWRKMGVTAMGELKTFNRITNHGPYASGFYGDLENDIALCVHCSHWSRLTCYWRKRCTLHNWPPNQVFDDILRNGCHFVPVGSKMAGAENELEWRLSFSHAEQNLVYSMNHTQFLCYGLLKIFLKEVINHTTEEPFLCSYFAKTTMFWLIQIGHITWCPNNLLDCFWKCFKYLLHCVHNGGMPNFFIPQNNMFISKLSTVKGARTRECLLEQLNMYYEMSMTCLLQSPTVRKIIEPVICNSMVRIMPLQGHVRNIADTDETIRIEIFRITAEDQNIKGNNYLCLKTMLILSHSTNSLYQKLTLQKCIADVLVNLKPWFLQLECSSDCANKAMYKSDRLICNMLRLADRVGDVCCLLYLALYYYRTCRYREALHVTTVVKARLSQPYIMYNTVDKEKYNEFVAGWSLFKRMKKAWADVLRFHNHVYLYKIQELILEQKVSLENDEPILYISPYVLTDMLSVLCNYRLGNRSQCLQSLTDLQTLLLYDDRGYVDLDTRDISWQILGICQQVVGDLHGALQSYQQSLRQEPWHKIQKATHYRIALIVNQLNDRH